ncbi:MAG: 4-hydroxy-3-methylbut-2-en-1-yl diphosphate synthase [Spirochaetes bacterium GWF1_51_8]|nr:MAG: 4-hydroxy-3-methylbut-2-en-1-yl diphosphate synthase [Spirochaetes bacterium GWF1_51_8]
MERRKSLMLKIGNVEIGGNAPVSIQSMTTTPTSDVEATLAQILVLADAGCDIVRLGIPDTESARAVKAIKSRGCPIPVVADIHFDHKLALICADGGADGLRINPGNLKKPEHVRDVVKACKNANIPIRIGVNAGSLDRAKYPVPNAEAMVQSALEHIGLLEKEDYYEIKVSLKSHDVVTMIEANRMFTRLRNYPLHLGVTEAGDYAQALVKNSIGIGALLLDGIGDTIRVSITGDPLLEIDAARMILRSLGLRMEGVEIVSCPTCARKEFDVERTVREFLDRTRGIKKYIKVAIMGCVVNGPGEASDADFGVAAGKSGAVLFKKGEVVKKIAAGQILEALLEEAGKYR